MKTDPIRNVLLSSAVLLLAACGGGGGGGSGGTQTGTLNLKVTDAPVDEADKVVVVFTGVELKPTSGAAFSRDFTAKSIDLLQLQNGATATILNNEQIPVGTYEWMRLKVRTDQTAQDASYIEVAGARYNLRIPSGDERGLQLIRGFTVAQGSTTNFLIDFDLRKSVVAPPGQAPQYLLKPVLRVMDELQIGRLAGTVNLTTLATTQIGPNATAADCKGGLYVFNGATATPDDQDRVDTDGADPVVYVMLEDPDADGSAAYSIPFMAAGPSYTVSATCNADIDVADTNDYNPTATQGQPGYQTMKWTSVNNVTIPVNGTATVNLP